MKMDSFIVQKHNTARDENIQLFKNITYFFCLNHENTGFHVKFLKQQYDSGSLLYK